MMRWRNIKDCAVFEFSSADTALTLRKLNDAGIGVSHVVRIDDFTLQFEVPRNRIQQTDEILERHAESHRHIADKGISLKLLAFLHRPVLLLGLAVMVFLVFFLPSRVLFVQVVGNDTVPAKQILQCASQCGIRFGASRKDVRSEKVKNELIAQIPSLQWIGVNTDGCVAVISVREGTESEIEPKKKAVGSIVATRDGVIISCTVLRGSAVCKPGQAVTKGEMLVSGYTDCGIYLQATCAEAEILASTTRNLSVITPRFMYRRQELTKQTTSYRLKIGNYLINLYEGSGISDSTCVKIYQQKDLTLPGGFILPVSVITETCYYYDASPNEMPEQTWMESYAKSYLKTQMVAGEILSEKTQISCLDNAFYLTGKYDCTEMIGQIKIEERTEEYGNNGKNS